MRITLRAKGQLTLPEAIRAAARLAEDDLLEVEVTKDGAVVLRPLATVDGPGVVLAARASRGRAGGHNRGGPQRGERFGSGQAFLDPLADTSQARLTES
jgi:AbrB family looped-hinge helix DNA binding protein